MIWKVYRRDLTTDEIAPYNVFDHWGFSREVAELKKRKNITKEEFAEELRHLAMYYFWGKYEHEIVITSFPPYITSKERQRLAMEMHEHCDRYGTPMQRQSVNLERGEKIDIYQQLRLNWGTFVDYVWNN